MRAKIENLCIMDKLSKRKYSAFKSYYEWMKEENFQYLKKMYSENRIYHLNLNILDDLNRFDILGSWIIEQNLKVDTVYVSNILDWVKRKNSQNEHKYYSNLSNLITDQIYFMTSSINAKAPQSEKSLFLRLEIW
jgi:hypothetical protein